MGQILFPENIGALTKASNTQVQLAPSVLNCGGQQYTSLTNLTCTTSTSGFGGLDTGAIAANSLYYVYAVINSGVIGLVMSINAIAPTGFSSFRLVGTTFTNFASYIQIYQYYKNHSWFTTKIFAQYSLTSVQTITVTSTVIATTTLITDTHNCYDTSVNQFICPISGIFGWNAQAYSLGTPSAACSVVNVLKRNTVSKGYSSSHRPAALGASVCISALVSDSCSAGDTLGAYINCSPTVTGLTLDASITTMVEFYSVENG